LVGDDGLWLVYVTMSVDVPCDACLFSAAPAGAETGSMLGLVQAWWLMTDNVPERHTHSQFTLQLLLPARMDQVACFVLASVNML
jgi:hypothetical protein